MGWTSFSMRGQSVKEWFRKEWDYEGSKYEVIDSALVERSSLYGAIRKKDTGEIFCAVFLIRWSKGYYNFSYKDMTEHVGPSVCNCPQRIMKLLSPLNDENDPNGWARAWRKRVEEYWNTRNTINSGGIIKTENPVSFTSGDEYQYFKKVGRKLWAGIMIENEFRMTCPVRVNLSNYNLAVS
jgi:hypothetical protein